MTRRIVHLCNVVMEVTWLLALVSIPIFFNIYTGRVFEPDKITLFRSLALVMAGAWLTKVLALRAADTTFAPVRPTPRKNRNQREDFPPDGEVIGPDNQSFFRTLVTRPLVIPAYVLSFAYVAATLVSVVPGVSWWGSYDRLQGTYSFLSYIIFFLVIAFNLRERRQLERLISFVLLTTVPVTLYGIMQHNKADPLPWQGDTTFRVTSTMGNAIFISAYLIMIVPLALYRVLNTAQWLFVHRPEMRRSISGRPRNTALQWFALYGFFLIFELGLFLVVLNLNANYRPESTGIAQANPLALIENSGSAAGNSNQLVGGTTIGPVWSLPLALLISFGLFFLFTVKRKDMDNNYLFRMVEFGCYLLIFALAIVVIVYSQSRGPLAGLLFSLYLVPPILFIVYKRWKLLATWLGVGIAGGVVLLLFNFPAGSTPLEPAFSILRKNPEIARLGQFLQTEDGTGKVRRLIWETDFELLGNTASKDPLRLLLGNGPESMYYITPQFYQPELAYIEARNAVPDRSHNAYLDALVTTGIFGLLAYVAFVGFYFYYCVVFLRRTRRFDYRVLLACLIAAMLAHLIEIVTGIQVISSWMMFFTCAGLVAVLGGLIKGSYAPAEKAVIESAAVAEEKPLEPAAKSKVTTVATAKTNEKPATKYTPRPGGAKVTSVRSGGASATTSLSYSDYLALTLPEAPVKSWFWFVLGALVLIFGGYCYVANFVPVVADTAFKQAQNLTASKRPDEALVYFLQATRSAPSEDRYALYLGQTYLELADQVKQTEQQKQAQKQTADPDAQNKIVRYLQASESELMRANQIAPLNPDHYANLARLYGQWVEYDPSRAKELFTKQTEWYTKAVEYAPRNSRIRTEFAVAQLNLARSVDGGVDSAMLQEGLKTAEGSVKLDPCYDFTRWVLGDAYMSSNRNDDAAAQYAKLAEISPKEFANNNRYMQRIQTLAGSAVANPALIIPALQRPLVTQDPAKAEAVRNSDGCPLTQYKDISAVDQATFHQTLGMYLFHQNRLQEAEGRLNEASRLDPNNAYALAYLAVVYQKTNRAAQAQPLVEKALKAAGTPGSELYIIIQNFMGGYIK